MSKHLNLPILVKVSTDSITKSCFQTSLILLEGLFILVRCLISLRSLLRRFLFVFSSFFPRFHDNFQPCFFSTGHTHFLSPHLHRWSATPVSPSLPPYFLFFAIFKSFVCSLPLCHPACQECLVGILISHFAQAQIAHSLIWFLFLSSAFCNQFYFLLDFFCLRLSGDNQPHQKSVLFLFFF
jgi:hypothetical protein